MKTTGSLGTPQILTPSAPQAPAEKKGISFKIEVNVDREVVTDMVDTALKHAREAGIDTTSVMLKSLGQMASFLGAKALGKPTDTKQTESGMLGSAFSALRGAATLIGR